MLSAVRRFAGLTFAAIFLVLAALVWYVLRTAAAASDTADSVDRAVAALALLEESGARLTTAESGTRGFVITGAPEFLVAVDSARDSLPRLLDGLHESSAPGADQRARLDSLERFVAARLDRLALLAQLRRTGRGDSAVRVVATGEGLRQMEAIRGVIDRMSTEERRLLYLRSAELRDARQHLRAALVAGGALALLFVGIAGVLLVRDAREIDRSAEALKRSESLYRTLAANFPNGAVLLFDRNMRYVLADGMGLQEADLPSRTIRGRTMQEVFPPETAAVLEPHYRAALDGEARELLIPYRARVYQMFLRPLRDEAGRVWGGLVMTQDASERERSRAERERLIVQLEDSLARVKQLSGLLPICAGCKKIRDDQGYWRQIEVYIRDHSEAEFSHGLCPDCARAYWGDLASATEE